MEWAFSCSREALLLCEGWSAGRSLLFRRGIVGASAAMNWQFRCPVWLFGCLFGAAPAALRILVSYRTLARDEPQARSQLVWELFEASRRRQVHRGFGPHYALLSFLLSCKTLLISRTRASLSEPRRLWRVYRSHGPDDKTTIAENPDTKPSLLESH